MTELLLADALEDAAVFTDGDWVESKDQDPNGDVRLVQLADIGVSEYLYKSARFMTSEKAAELNCTYLKAGDVLVARMPDPIGRACIFPGLSTPAVTVVDVCVIRPDPTVIDSRWLMHWFNSETAGQVIQRSITGTTRKRISRGNIGKLPIVLPPLEEQKRIAGILDAADQLRTKRQLAAAKLETLVTVTFQQISNPSDSENRISDQLTLSELCDRIQIGPFGSLLHESDYVKGGIPIINPVHIVDGKIKPQETKSVRPNKHQTLEKYWLEPDDIVMGRRGEMGRCAVVGQNEAGYLCGSGSLFLRANQSKVLPLYLSYLLSSPRIKSALEQTAQGVTMPNLNSTVVGNLSLDIPDISTQQLFVSALEKITGSLSRMNKSLRELETLFSSLQQRAFRGEL